MKNWTVPTAWAPSRTAHKTTRRRRGRNGAAAGPVRPGSDRSQVEAVQPALSPVLHAEKVRRETTWAPPYFGAKSPEKMPPPLYK